MNRYYEVVGFLTVEVFNGTYNPAPEFGPAFLRQNSDKIILSAGSEIHSLEGGDFAIIDGSAKAIRRLPEGVLTGYDTEEFDASERTVISNYRE